MKHLWEEFKKLPRWAKNFIVILVSIPVLWIVLTVIVSVSN